MCPEFVNIEAERKRIGLTIKDSKSVDRAPTCTALGRDLVDGNFLMSKRSRLRDAVNVLITVLTLQTMSPADFTHVYGVFQWMLLANRPMLSCVGSCYHFARADDHTSQLVPNTDTELI